MLFTICPEMDFIVRPAHPALVTRHAESAILWTLRLPVITIDPKIKVTYLIERIEFFAKTDSLLTSPPSSCIRKSDVEHVPISYYAATDQYTEDSRSQQVQYNKANT